MSSSPGTLVEKVRPPDKSWCSAEPQAAASAACQCAASTIHAACCQFWPWDGPGFKLGRKGSPGTQRLCIFIPVLSESYMCPWGQCFCELPCLAVLEVQTFHRI